ncbi:MAG: SpoIID/LytB domain-containing protein [Lachnospiraceae bacterium]|nr:SpoIID/LytB domain-containing protein [Lachnospiraceae bacterium]
MKRQSAIWKWLLVLAILAAIITILIVYIKNTFMKEPEGTFMQREDAYLLYTYLYEDTERLGESDVDFQLISNISQNGLDGEAKDIYLTKGEAFEMFDLLQQRYPTYEGELLKLREQSFLNNRRNSSFILAEEFLACYEQLWLIVHPDLPLWETRGVFMADISDIRELDDSTISGNGILVADTLEDNLASGVKLYDRTKRMEKFQSVTDDDLYGVRAYWGAGEHLIWDCSGYETEPLQQEFYLKTCWISSNQPGIMWVSFEDYQIAIRIKEDGVKLSDGTVYEAFEDIADLYFSNGVLDYIVTYDERVSGKLLSVSDEYVELEGVGFIPYRANMAVYKLYGHREYYTQSDLKIGYDFTDFVLDQEGNIVAGLVTREEKMDSIRVVVKTTDFASAYHESITFTCDSDFLVNDEKHLAGEEITVALDDVRLAEGRIYIRPETNLARTSVLSIGRAQGTAAYRGNFEIAKTEKGLLLINEVLLEEYLYSVVPSEMPASYPAEALKAQAVSARTYAYQRMLNSGLKEYGAHVDDSAAFQVYNNIKESETTTLAIRETQGQIAMIGDKLAESYYYSTSCGFGTDISAWHSSSEDKYGYLVSKHINRDAVNGSDTVGDIRDEETFRSYIMTANAADYESGEGWYRWSYDTNLNIERLNQNLQTRYEASPKSITVPLEGDYVSGKPPVFSQIIRMEVVKRGPGGVMDELILEGPEGTVKVVGEHAIRSVLANDGNKVMRQNGTESAVSSLLPSAFAVVDVEVDTETNSIVSYHLTGGGYGHGIGMSQNGARSMALSGMSCEEILGFFYDSVTLQDMYSID